jgi:hypothetical protein
MFIHHPPAGNYHYAPETLAYLGENSLLYQRASRIKINQLILGLIADGVWPKIYQLVIYASPSGYSYPGNYPDLTQALKTLKQQPWGPQNVGAGLANSTRYSEHPSGYYPKFTTFRGFNLNSADNRFARPGRWPMFGNTIVNSNFVADIPGLINDFSFGVWSLSDSQTDGGDVGVTDWGEDYDFNTSAYSHNTEAGWGLKLRTTAGNLRYRVNSETWRDIPSATSKGFFVASRSSSSAMNVFRNGVQIDAVAEPSKPLSGTSALMGLNLHQMAGQNETYACDRYFVGMTNERPNGLFRNAAGGVAMHPQRSNREYCAHFFGQGLTATDQANLFNRLKTYLLTHLSASDLGV